MKVIIDNNIFKVKLCTTPKSIQEGMMGKNFDETFNGMLFFLPKGEQSFWMYNCIVPLDIIMIDGNEITDIHHNCQPCDNMGECESYRGFGDCVLEIPGGYCKENGIKKGDTVSFSMF
jgi:uncharacterized membrane protein (UPF0127 family)